MQDKRMTSIQHEFIHALGVGCSISQRSTPLCSPWCRWCHSVPSVTHSSCSFKLMFITRLRCAEPPNVSAFPSSGPRPISAHVRVNPISPSIARHLCCVRLSPRPSGHKARFQRYVLLTSSCLIVNLNRCPQPVVSVAAEPLDSSSLCDPKRHTRPSSSYAAARSSSIRAVPSEPRVCTRQFHDGQLTACHRLLHPQDLGIEISHSSHSAVRGNRFRRCGVHTYTWLYHLCHVSSHCHCVQSSRCTLGQRVTTKRRDARQASRTKTKSTVGFSHILPSRCLRRRPR